MQSILWAWFLSSSKNKFFGQCGDLLPGWNRAISELSRECLRKWGENDFSTLIIHSVINHVRSVLEDSVNADVSFSSAKRVSIAEMLFSIKKNYGSHAHIKGNFIEAGFFVWFAAFCSAPAHFEDFFFDEFLSFDLKAFLVKETRALNVCYQNLFLNSAL